MSETNAELITEARLRVDPHRVMTHVEEMAFALGYEAARSAPAETHLTLANAAEAIASTVHGWGIYMESSKPYEQVNAFRALQDAVSDLASWHPLYDCESGEIKDEFYDIESTQ